MVQLGVKGSQVSQQRRGGGGGEGVAPGASLWSELIEYGDHQNHWTGSSVFTLPLSAAGFSAFWVPLCIVAPFCVWISNTKGDEWRSCNGTVSFVQQCSVSDTGGWGAGVLWQDFTWLKCKTHWSYLLHLIGFTQTRVFCIRRLFTL